MSPDPGKRHDVAELVAQNAQFESDFALAALERIGPLLRRDAGSARGQFRFYRAAGVGAADGRVTADLVLTCQRCLGEMTFPVDARFRLAFVESDSASVQVPATHEPVILGDGSVLLSALVEDELLLALPLAPMHDDSQHCGVRVAPDPTERSHRPFAGLRGLMKD